MKHKIIAALLAGSVIFAGSVQASSPAAAESGNIQAQVAADSKQAEEKGPFKVAVFKIIDRSGCASTNMLSMLEKRTERELHVPLNGYLQKIKVYSWEETLKAYQELPEEQKMAKDRTVWLKGVSEKLGADMVFCLVINSCYEHTWIDWHGETCYEATCELELTGWDSAGNKPVKRKAGRWVRDEYMLGSDLETLALEALEEIFAKEKIRDRFFPMKEQR